MKKNKVYTSEVSRQWCNRPSNPQNTVEQSDSVYKPSRLVAVWGKGQDSSFDDPFTVVWEGGRIATLDEYRAHEFDTHFIVFPGNRRVEKHIFPDIVAEVSFEENVGDWVVRGRDVKTAALGLNDPDAGDDYIRYWLFTLPMFYRAKIIR